jgi:hypothetical protein
MPLSGGPALPRENKPSWNDVPEAIRDEVARVVSDSIVEAETVWGGFGPSATFALRGKSGRRYFCKGAHPGQTNIGNDAARRERQNFEDFPELAEFCARYLGSAEHGDWLMLVLDHVPKTMNVPPWSRPAFDAAIKALANFHRASPARAVDRLQPAKQDQLINLFRQEMGWAALAAHEAPRENFLGLFENRDEARTWFDRAIEVLVSCEKRAYDLGGPECWMHQDIRSDNLLFCKEPLPKIVDWPYLAFGPALMDVAFFLPSVAGEGGPAPATGLRLYEQMNGTTFAANDVASAAAAVSGFFAARAGEPDIPQLPRLRWVQRLQLYPALAWTTSLLGIDMPQPRQA